MSLWITRLAYLNILWISFTLAGLGVLGIFPATAAMFAVVRKWTRGEDEIPITATFWKAFKKEFLQANKMGYCLLLIGYALIQQLQILWRQEDMMYVLAGFGVLLLVFLYAIVLLYAFPVFAHFQLSVLNYIKWPVIIGVVHPLLTIVLAVALFFIYTIVYATVPALLFFFGGSITAYILTWGAGKTFAKYEQQTAPIN
ncbi:YesL family protein [Oceanobacillus kapialis]|uniref:YesL family protein n=1 Tax=Oceanobacillus kapialis TaxID=481353 RepID=UPI00384FE35E